MVRPVDQKQDDSGLLWVALECWGIVIPEVSPGSESLTSSDALVLQGLIPLGYWKVWPPSPGQHLCFPLPGNLDLRQLFFPSQGETQLLCSLFLAFCSAAWVFCL